MTSVQAEETPASNTTNTASADKGKPAVHKTDYEKDVVYLYQFSRCPTLPSASPFCLKVETWLRMTEVRYENVDHKMKYKSKKGQLPFVEINGVEIADSDIIIKELSQIFGKDLDENLTLDQKNVSHAFVSMLNNHTSWVMRWWRYSHPGEFLKAAQLDIKRTLNSKLPKGLLHFFFKLGFKSNIKRAVGHGVGRHNSDEIYEFGKKDLKALSEYLAEKPYFFGEEPHLLDCVAFSHLCQFVYIPFGGLKEYLESDCTNLLSFVERMKERYWPDWEEMCKTLELNTHLPKKVEEPPKEEGEKKESKEAEEPAEEKNEKEDKAEKLDEKIETKEEEASEKPKEDSNETKE
ncbi:failed axon connections-like [Stegodyphus dumicola]|uniref:failed axon connections-like n=1 Tax=Stegodyphus dumicola TaxID=202533 RepID=UPI0015B1D820|nr:failed axon connections-like [Stegodyphus dumicola]